MQARDPVSVEPLPKQGCEEDHKPYIPPSTRSQWNPCRSRGARVPYLPHGWRIGSLSGTPAEAGVRDDLPPPSNKIILVSVEPLPKQGCESALMISMRCWTKSQWNPCRSRGARCGEWWEQADQRPVSVEPLPKQGCEMIYLKMVGYSASLSGTPAEAGVRGHG